MILNEVCVEPMISDLNITFSLSHQIFLTETTDRLKMLSCGLCWFNLLTDWHEAAGLNMFHMFVTPGVCSSETRKFKQSNNWTVDPLLQTALHHCSLPNLHVSAWNPAAVNAAVPRLHSSEAVKLSSRSLVSVSLFFMLSPWNTVWSSYWHRVWAHLVSKAAASWGRWRDSQSSSHTEWRLKIRELLFITLHLFQLVWAENSDF